MYSKSLSKFDAAQFPARCPKCRRSTGEVRVAATVLNAPNVIRLTIICKPCGHEWLMDKEAEARITAPSSQPLHEKSIN
jgi:C4-type Zn-finger protein